MFTRTPPHHARQPSSLLALGLLLGLCSCGAQDPTPADPTSSPDPDEQIYAPMDDPTPACAAGLCLDDGTLDELEVVEAELAGCTPAEDTFDGDGSGLRISGLELVEDEEGGWAVEVTLGNVDEVGVWSYPGFGLRAVGGEGELAPSEMSDAEGLVQLYGIEACNEMSATFPLGLQPGGEIKLEATAYNDLGEVVIDQLLFSVLKAD